MRSRAAFLALCLLATPAAAQTSTPAPDFAPFWKEFSAAAKAGEKAKVRALTKFPFDYDGKKRGENDFDPVWKGLFTGKARACLGRGKPVKDGGNHVIFCGEVGFYFEPTPAGWRFTEVGPND